ncbi:hypothetical protein, partial [Halomonas sp. BC2]|uniref:hypothetical protein n=1 Tax=Halomonas sp. BC2 TaxID=1670449 RepID=UPI001BB0387F
LFRGRVDTDFSGFQHGIAAYQAVYISILAGEGRKSTPSSASALPACIPARLGEGLRGVLLKLTYIKFATPHSAVVFKG